MIAHTNKMSKNVVGRYAAMFLESYQENNVICNMDEINLIVSRRFSICISHCLQKPARPVKNTL